MSYCCADRAMGHPGRLLLIPLALGLLRKRTRMRCPLTPPVPVGGGDYSTRCSAVGGGA